MQYCLQRAVIAPRRPHVQRVLAQEVLMAASLGEDLAAEEGVRGRLEAHVGARRGQRVGPCA